MLLYEGKAKCIYSTDNVSEVEVFFKDDMTAFNGVKRSELGGKGALNAMISVILFEYLESCGVRTHFKSVVDSSRMICEKVEVIKLEFICRNRVTGSLKKRLGFQEDFDLDSPIFEICYKDDSLGDPLINNDHALLLGVCSKQELDACFSYVSEVNKLLCDFFKLAGIKLADFKLEFGKNAAGEILLVDEISPDNCRLYDLKTNEQFDKDLFRLDSGDVLVGYQTVLDRIKDARS